ncbi:MAG: sugar ABC transporter permease [Verrucomicrobia bacterium]|nr:sugar ABC transporter permease [Verrucomicrobiota bacterium]
MKSYQKPSDLDKSLSYSGASPYQGQVRSSRQAPGLSAQNLPYLLLLPSVFLIFVIEFYPFITGVLYSLHKGTLLNRGAFVGLDNYIHLFNSTDFYHSLYFSSVFALSNVLFSYLIGLGLALLLNLDFPGRGFCRVALLIPWIVPAIVSIVSWKWLIADRGGLANIILQTLGLGPIYFLSQSGWAMVAVIVIKIWRSFPFMMLTLLAALQVIDRTLYEAGKLDGANSRQLFWHITLPHLKNISIVQAILMVIWSINDFETPYLLTQGGPSNATENLILLSYRYTFGRNDVGRGSAVALLTLVFLMILATLMLRQQRSVA